LPRVDTEKFAVSFDIDYGITARADGEQWQLIVTNLLDNAVKYSPNGGAIDVYLTREKNLVKLAVSDQGQGFDHEQSERIFGRFYRVGNEHTRKTSGVGLGLYLVKEIAESFGGKVRGESHGPGKGAKFIVELPYEEDKARG
jgi:signal transduction histidine kinase